MTEKESRPNAATADIWYVRSRPRVSIPHPANMTNDEYPAVTKREKTDRRVDFCVFGAFSSTNEFPTVIIKPPESAQNAIGIARYDPPKNTNPTDERNTAAEIATSDAPAFICPKRPQIELENAEIKDSQKNTSPMRSFENPSDSKSGWYVK